MLKSAHFMRLSESKTDKEMVLYSKPQKWLLSFHENLKSTLFEKGDLSPFFGLNPLNGHIAKKNRFVKGERGSCIYP